MPHDCDDKQSEVLMIDGRKVTIRYGTQKNPSAIKAIKGTLLTSIVAKKK